MYPDKILGIRKKENSRSSSKANLKKETLSVGIRNVLEPCLISGY